MGHIRGPVCKAALKVEIPIQHLLLCTTSQLPLPCSIDSLSLYFTICNSFKPYALLQWMRSNKSTIEVLRCVVPNLWYCGVTWNLNFQGLHKDPINLYIMYTCTSNKLALTFNTNKCKKKQLFKYLLLLL